MSIVYAEQRCHCDIAMAAAASLHGELPARRLAATGLKKMCIDKQVDASWMARQSPVVAMFVRSVTFDGFLVRTNGAIAAQTTPQTALLPSEVN